MLSAASTVGKLQSMCLCVFVLVCLKLIITYICFSKKKSDFRSLQGSTRFSQLAEELLRIMAAFELDTGMQRKCRAA